MVVHGHRRAFTIAGDGPPLLLLHGIGSNRFTWRPVLPALARRFTVVAPDLLGHGESAKPRADYSIGGFANGMRDLLGVLGMERATVVGHSFGGGVAMQFAYQFPERTERLVLISSGGLGSEVTAMLRAATLPGAETLVAGLSKIPAPLTRQLLRALPALTARPDADPLAVGLRGLNGPRQRRAFVRTAHTVLDWRGQTVSASRQLGLLRGMPVLIAWGAQDKTIPPRHHHAFADQVPHATTLEIPAAGHYPQETAAQQLAPALTEFLATTTPFHYTETRWRQLLQGAPEHRNQTPAEFPDPSATTHARSERHPAAMNG